MSDFTLRFSIRSFLSSVGKKAGVMVGTNSLFWAVISLLFSWLTTFVCDRVWDTSSFLRTIILLIGLIGALGSTLYFLWFCKYRIGSYLWLARKVRETYRPIGQKLMGIIDLLNSHDINVEPHYSGKLLEAAQFKIEKDLKLVDSRKIFSWKSLQKTLIVFACVLLLATVPCFLIPEMLSNSIARWITPWESVPRMTLVKMDSSTNPIFIPANEVHVIRFPISTSSRLKPKYAKISSSQKPKILQTTRANANFFEFSLPPIQTPHSINLTCGDFHSEIKLEPIERPNVLHCKALVSWPSYTKIPKTEENLTQGQNLQIIRGTRLKIKGSANRVLSSLIFQKANHREFQDLNSNSFTIDDIFIKESEVMKIRIQDSYGFSQKDAFWFGLKMVEDLSPTAIFPPPLDLSDVLEFETRMIEMRVRDDLGLKSYELILEVRREDQNLFEQTIAKYEFEEFNRKESVISFPFLPEQFGLEDGDSVSFKIVAKDRFPERKPTISNELKLQIVGSEKHAQIMTERLENLMGEVAGIARDQETLQSQTENQSEKLIIQRNPVLNQEEAKQLKMLLDQQISISDRLSSASGRGLKLLARASKNPLFEASRLQAFGNAFKAMNEIAENQLHDAQQEMLLEDNSYRDQVIERFIKASEFQLDALARLKRLLDAFSKELEKLEAQSLAQRLRKIEGVEKKISMEIYNIIPKTLGKSNSLLSSHHQARIKILKSNQEEARKEAQETQDEISRFFERTGVFEYQKVSSMMKEFRTNEGMQVTAEKIKDNISLQALADLAVWEGKFSAWAKILENQFNESDQFGGEGESSQKNKDQEILQLLKIKEEQKNILQRTRFFEEQKFKNNPLEWQRSLGDRQERLAIDLTDTQISLAKEALNPLFDEAHTAMSQAYSLLSRQFTDSRTQMEQSKAKDLVSDLINLLVEGRKSESDQNAKDEMSMIDFLLMKNRSGEQQSSEGKSPSTGKKGGGFNKKGGEGKELKPFKGENLEAAMPERKTNSGPVITPSIPPEFQEAMERYINRIQ
ncbi:MAG: hypothetical protein VX153_04265 [Verrucomicrobiota bacterium]|nr:hypothetical protein [Verrucomicrobiota bacterium]